MPPDERQPWRRSSWGHRVARPREIASTSAPKATVAEDAPPLRAVLAAIRHRPIAMAYAGLMINHLAHTIRREADYPSSPKLHKRLETIEALSRRGCSSAARGTGTAGIGRSANICVGDQWGGVGREDFKPAVTPDEFGIRRAFGEGGSRTKPASARAAQVLSRSHFWPGRAAILRSNCSHGLAQGCGPVSRRAQQDRAAYVRAVMAGSRGCPPYAPWRVRRSRRVRNLA